MHIIKFISTLDSGDAKFVQSKWPNPFSAAGILVIGQASYPIKLFLILTLDSSIYYVGGM
jgi:hypothetical protein